MASGHGTSDSPVPGLYDHLLSAALEGQIQQLAKPELALVGDVDPDDAHTAIAQYLEHLLVASLSNVRGRDGSDRRRCPDETQLAKGIRRLAHIDDPRQIAFLIDHSANARAIDQLDPTETRRASMLHVTLWGREGVRMSLGEAEARWRANPTAVMDLHAILEYRRAHTHTRPTELIADLAGPLAVHAEYTRDEILTGLGHWDMKRRPDFREGVLHLAERKTDVFFVTLHKTEEAYSPTTMYEDYAISDRLFHWQSQSTTSADSPTGQRYIHHRREGYTPLLFVREHKYLPGGLASPYAFLGPARYVSHEGSRPMSIVWQLDTPMPARLLTRVTRGQTA